MKNLNKQNRRLLSLFVVLIAGVLIVHSFFTPAKARPNAVLMHEAAELSQSWFTIIAEKKQELGIQSDVISNVPNKALIGNDWSEMTTTLGSREAKELTTNPDFAALMVKLLSEAGIKKGKRVGVMLSGSFPALAIATFSALQTMEIDALVICSLGASSFGANQPRATWLDYENWLSTDGGFKYHSSLITRGAENDIGDGLIEAGIDSLERAVKRNNRYFFNIDLLINIGGGQAAMGSCVHNLSIPNGLHLHYEGCRDNERGVITRISEQGIPFIHLLNIKDLAVQNGIPIAPGKTYSASTGLYEIRKTSKAAIGGVLVLGLIGLFFLRKETEINKIQISKLKFRK